MFDSNVFVYTSSFFLQNFLFKEAPAMTNFLGKWSFSSSGGVCGLPVASSKCGKHLRLESTWDSDSNWDENFFGGGRAI